jgi:hypothetical protein
VHDDWCDSSQELNEVTGTLQKREKPCQSVKLDCNAKILATQVLMTGDILMSTNVHDDRKPIPPDSRHHHFAQYKGTTCRRRTKACSRHYFIGNDLPAQRILSTRLRLGAMWSVKLISFSPIRLQTAMHVGLRQDGDYLTAERPELSTHLYTVWLMLLVLEL